MSFFLSLPPTLHVSNSVSLSLQYFFFLSPSLPPSLSPHVYLPLQHGFKASVRQTGQARTRIRSGQKNINYTPVFGGDRKLYGVLTPVFIYFGQKRNLQVSSCVDWFAWDDGATLSVSLILYLINKNMLWIVHYDILQ